MEVPFKQRPNPAYETESYVPDVKSFFMEYSIIFELKNHSG